MIKENWCFWLILIGFIAQCISVVLYAAGMKKTTTMDGNLTDRLVGIVLSAGLALVYAITLGWLG